MKSINRTILAALTCAAISLSLGSISTPAHANDGFGIQIGSGGIRIEIGNGHHRRHHNNCGNPCGNCNPCGNGGGNYQQPAPFIDVTVNEIVGGWQDEWRTDCCGRQYRTGRQVWVEQQVQRYVRAYWDPRSRAYWYVDSYGNNIIVN